MPDIFGVELRNIVIQNGEDHEYINASIYIENKRVGEALDDGWCDEIYVEFKNNKNLQKFNDAVKKYYKKNKIKSSTSDIFIRKLLHISGQYIGEKSHNTQGFSQLCFIDKDLEGKVLI